MTLRRLAAALFAFVAAVGGADSLVNRAAAQVEFEGKHELEIAWTSLTSLAAPFEELELSPGFSLKQQVRLDAFGVAPAGWRIDGYYDSALPLEERFRLEARRGDDRVEAGQVVSESRSRLGWKREVIGVAARLAGEGRAAQALVGEARGWPVETAFRGDGTVGPFDLGEGPALAGSLRLEVDGRRLEEGIDFTFDLDRAEVVFAEPVPFTAIVKAAYEIEAEGLQTVGFGGAWDLGAVVVGISGARESGAAPPGDDPFGMTAYELSLSTPDGAGPLDVDLAGYASRIEGEERESGRAVWAAAAWSPASGPWSLAGEFESVGEGYRPVGRGRFSESRLFRSELGYAGEGVRSTTSLELRTDRLQAAGGAADPFSRWMLGQAFAAGPYSLEVGVGRLLHRGDEAGQGRLELGYMGASGSLQAGWERVGAIAEDGRGAVIESAALAGESPLAGGTLAAGWEREAVEGLQGGAAVYATSSVGWRRNHPDGTAWSGGLQRTGAETSSGSEEGLRLFAERRRSSRLGGAAVVRFAWDRKTSGVDPGEPLMSAFASTGGPWRGGELSLEGAVSHGAATGAAAAARAAWGSSGPAGGRIEVEAYAPAGSALRTRGRGELIRPIGGIGLKLTIAFGHLETFPSAAFLAGARRAGPDPVEIGWKADLAAEWARGDWRAWGGAGATVRHVTGDPGKAGREDRITVGAGRALSERLDAEAKWAGKREERPAGVERTSRWSATLGWWIEVRSRIAVTLEHTLALPAGGGAAFATVGTLKLETYF